MARDSRVVREGRAGTRAAVDGPFIADRSSWFPSRAVASSGSPRGVLALWPSVRQQRQQEERAEKLQNGASLGSRLGELGERSVSYGYGHGQTGRGSQDQALFQNTQPERRVRQLVASGTPGEREQVVSSLAAPRPRWVLGSLCAPCLRPTSVCAGPPGLGWAPGQQALSEGAAVNEKLGPRLLGRAFAARGGRPAALCFSTESWQSSAKRLEPSCPETAKAALSEDRLAGTSSLREVLPGVLVWSSRTKLPPGPSEESAPFSMAFKVASVEPQPLSLVLAAPPPSLP
ncbi:unnamed protein product [Rangifer tarandus platyrhynchus]|uniref:Uncharacterized protein n=2 Tax=Rangifer tarandus platyrhynchus TaxID=3082113 RepID=A0ABN8YR69_RANTA|nr:unnamed protein product [Rangifer tarandus platyrhynchus]CAI9696893.1 unnamed protein product [Rangifer tarandus platyrhynchus]